MRLCFFMPLGLFLVGAVGNSPARAENYLIGMDFLQTRTSYSESWNRETLSPFQITDSANAFVTGGALGGWTETAARHAVTLAVEDLFREVLTGDVSATLDIQVFDGRVPTTLAGRRLNMAVGFGAVLTGAYGYSGLNAAFETSSYANDSYAGIVYLNNIDDLNVTYTQFSQVANAIAGTAAHEIAHLFGLQHVAVGPSQPYPIMATGPTGLTDSQRLTARSFETTPGTQSAGQSSVSVLLAALGTSYTSDFNRSGTVDLDDASVLLANWGQQAKLMQDGDANHDHLVNLDDASVLLSQWGMRTTPSAALAALPTDTATYFPAASVPEPSMIGLLCVAGLLGCSRVRRSHRESVS